MINVGGTLCTFCGFGTCITELQNYFHECYFSKLAVTEFPKSCGNSKTWQPCWPQTAGISTQIQPLWEERIQFPRSWSKFPLIPYPRDQMPEKRVRSGQIETAKGIVPMFVKVLSLHLRWFLLGPDETGAILIQFLPIMIPVLKSPGSMLRYFLFSVSGSPCVKTFTPSISI